MKHCIILLVSLALSLGFSPVFAQSDEAEDSLNRLIEELYELGDRQNPEEIDYIPPLTEEEYQDLVEYSKFLTDSINSAEGNINDLENEKSEKLSFSEFLENNPTIATGTSLVSYLGWFVLILYALLGWLLIKRKRLFIGKMLLSSLLPLCLIFLLAVNTDLSYYPHAWALAMMIIYSPILWCIGCLYLYGYGVIIFIYKRSVNKYKVGLLLSILLCTVFPPLFIVPIVIFIVKGNLKTEDCRNTFLYQLLPYLCGILAGLIISIPFCSAIGYFGRAIRELIYYLQYLW